MKYLANSAKGNFPVTGRHDPDTARNFGLLFKPSAWEANKVYGKSDDDNYDAVLPTEFTGLYYIVEDPGKSGSIEPTWVMVKDELTTDGTKGLVFKAQLYDLMPVTETITAATVTATNGVTISATTVTTTTVDFTIDAIISTATARLLGSFEVLTHATKSNGETVDVTLLFKIGEH
jgi:hypothetical protein